MDMRDLMNTVGSESLHEARVMVSGGSGEVTVTLSFAEAKVVAEALNHVARQVFQGEGDNARMLSDLASKLRGV